MLSRQWWIPCFSIGTLGIGILLADLLMAKVGQIGLIVIGGLLVILAIVIGAVLIRMGPNSIRPEVKCLIDELNTLDGYYRASAIANLQCPETLNDHEAGLILGNLSGAYRVQAIEALATRLHGLAKKGFAEALGDLDGYYRERAIAVISAPGSMSISFNRFH